MKPSSLFARIAPRATAAWAARRFLRTTRVVPTLAGARRSRVGELAVYTWGGEGPVALLVHGWNGHAGQMEPYVAPLLAKGYRVVAFDAPAHGGSGGDLAHLPAMAEAVLAVARAAGRLEIAIGHSLGATACARAAQRGMKVARMAWIAPAASVAWSSERFLDALALPAAARRLFRPRLERLVGVRLDDCELEAIAPSVRAEVLIVHDRDDAVVPLDQLLPVASALRAARFVLTRGLGHRRVLAEPDVVRAAVAFVDDLAELVHDPHPVPLVLGDSARAAA
jgi:pimeloyl-ACP methyl ester carboxylesterase